MSVNFRRDANTIIDLNAKTLSYKQLHEILKKTSFKYKTTKQDFTVVGIPFLVQTIDSVTKEEVVTEVQIKGNVVTIMTSQIPTNELEVTIISTLL